MKHRATHRGGAGSRASRVLCGASWLFSACVACADSDATPAYSYPFDPNAETPSTTPNNPITTVSPNQPGDDATDLDGDGLGTDDDATGGVGGVPGVGGSGGMGAAAGLGGLGGFGGVGGSPGQGIGGNGGLDGFDPADPDMPGLGGTGGVGGAAGGTP